MEGVYSAGAGGVLAGGGRALGSGIKRMAGGVIKFKDYMRARNAVDTPSVSIIEDYFQI